MVNPLWFLLVVILGFIAFVYVATRRDNRSQDRSADTPRASGGRDGTEPSGGGAAWGP